MPKPHEIIGRVDEWRLLDEMGGSGRPELAFVRGRRRIGKSFVLSRFTNSVGGL